MFNNLIESTSHAQEFKRRGSFLLFTTATYLLLFVVTGVVSIYAYDAHLEAQSTELGIVTFVPVTQPDPPPPVRPDPVNTVPTSGRTPTEPTRTDMIASTSDPTRVPPKIGTVATDVPPWTPGARIDLTNADPPATVASNSGVRGGTGNTPVINMPDPPPPPAPNPPPVIPKVLKRSVVLNSEALSLPVPNYPPIARQIRVQGVVTVQVLIDETGKVISAKALSGHPLLIPEAQRAAIQARFSPTTISGQPVKVSGMITYNFKMQ